MPPYGVVLVDDHPVVLAGLALLVESRPDLRVVATCTDAASAVGAVFARVPDVLVIDTRMPDVDGFDCARRIRALDVPQPRILLLAGSREGVTPARAMACGADGLVSKAAPPDEILSAVAAICRPGGAKPVR